MTGAQDPAAVGAGRLRAGHADPQGEDRYRSAARLCRAALAAAALGCAAAALARALAPALT